MDRSTDRNGISASPGVDSPGGRHEQFALLIDGVMDYAIVMLDPDGHVTSWNQGAERIQGYASEEIVGRHFSCFYLAEDNEAGHPAHVLRMAAAVGRFEEEGRRVRKDGSCFWATALVTALFGEDGELCGYGKLVRDVTERRDAELERDRQLAELQEAARVDDVTRLLNRRAWDEELVRELERARRYEVPLSIAILDLDGFKAFNDEFGHLAGDKMLRETASAWRPKLRSSDVIARFGGDEFSCMLPNCTVENAVGIVERVLTGTPARMTASAGVAQWDGAEGADQLFERADKALYAAKKQGRDRTVAAGWDPVSTSPAPRLS